MAGTMVLIGVVMLVALYCGQDGPSAEEIANDEYWLKHYEREFYEIFIWNDPEDTPFCKAVWDLAEKTIENDLFDLTRLRIDSPYQIPWPEDPAGYAHFRTGELRPVLEYLTLLIQDCLNDPRPTPAP